LSHGGVTTHDADSRRASRGCAPARFRSAAALPRPTARYRWFPSARSSRFPLGASQEQVRACSCTGPKPVATAISVEVFYYNFGQRRTRDLFPAATEVDRRVVAVPISTRAARSNGLPITYGIRRQEYRLYQPPRLRPRSVSERASLPVQVWFQDLEAALILRVQSSPSREPPEQSDGIGRAPWGRSGHREMPHAQQFSSCCSTTKDLSTKGQSLPSRITAGRRERGDAAIGAFRSRNRHGRIEFCRY